MLDCVVSRSSLSVLIFRSVMTDLETDPSIVKKRHLKRVLRCDRCPPHRKENAGRVPKRGAQKRKSKNKRRK